MIHKRYSLEWIPWLAVSVCVGCEMPVEHFREPPPPTCTGQVPTTSRLGVGGDTYVYVISDIVIDDTPFDANSAQSGFNLDGIYTAEDGSTPFSCGKPDQPSDLDPEENRPAAVLSPYSGRASPTCLVGCLPGAGCRGGVDNQFPNLVDALGTALSMAFPDGMRPVIRSNARQGKHPLLLVVSGVQSFEEDDSVEVRVFDAVQQFGRQCDEVLADREYAISASSTVNQDPGRSIYGMFRGSIRGGRLRTLGEYMPFPLPTRNVEQPFRLVLSGARINVDLRSESGTRGNAGGYFPGSQVVAYAQANGWQEPASPNGGFSFARIVPNFVDIEQPVPTEMTMASGLCVDRSDPTMPRFGNIGVGFRFSLVPVRLAPGVVDGRAPGACGYVAPAMDAGVSDGGDASIVDVPTMNVRDVAGDQGTADSNAVVDAVADGDRDL